MRRPASRRMIMSRRSLVTGLVSLSSLAATAARAYPLTAYRLWDTGGREVTDKTFLGSWQIVFFGFTTCPDICPTALFTLGMAAPRLARAVPTQPIFITVDPARDAPAQMKQYLEHYGGGIIGLRGTPAQTRIAAQAFRTRYAVTWSGDDTEVSHMGLFYVVNPAGRVVRTLRFDLTVDELLAELQALGVGAPRGAT